MVVVEGVGRSLDPNLNMWEVARPVVESYIKENLGPKAIIRDISESAKAIIIGRLNGIPAVKASLRAPPMG